MSDAQTLAVYEARAEDYARMVETAAPQKSLLRFMQALPPGARVLDLGCGPGGDSAHLRAAGFDPDPVDASGAMVQLACDRFGLPARQATFDDLTAKACYDGVWASFSLLHAARADLPRHVAAIARALRPGGSLGVGMKLGAGEGRDTLGRFYTYISVPELARLLTTAGLRVMETEKGMGAGLAGTLDPFVVMMARKDKDA